MDEGWPCETESARKSDPELCAVGVSLRSLNTRHAMEFCREILGDVTSILKPGGILGENITAMAKMFIPTVTLDSNDHL